jgi:hypothetical protein
MHPFTSPTPTSPGPPTMRQPEPGTSHGNISVADAVAAWCCQHDLGDKEAQCLRKLGFKIGDDLDELSDEMWKLAEALPLCRMHILRAYRSSKEVGRALQSVAQVG